MDHPSTNAAIPSVPSPSNSKTAEAGRSTAMTEQTDYSFVLSFQRSNSVRSSITIDNALKSFNIKEDLDDSMHPHSLASHSSHHHRLVGVLGLNNPLSNDQEDDHSEFFRRSCDTSDWEEDSVSITSRNLSETEDCLIAVEMEQEPQKMKNNDILGLTLKMKHLDDSNHNKTRVRFFSMTALASWNDEDSVITQAEEEQESIVDLLIR
jgi:hypothetical protein